MMSFLPANAPKEQCLFTLSKKNSCLKKNNKHVCASAKKFASPRKLSQHIKECPHLVKEGRMTTSLLHANLKTVFVLEVILQQALVAPLVSEVQNDKHLL